jgi:hypothetical protein
MQNVELQEWQSLETDPAFDDKTDLAHFTRVKILNAIPKELSRILNLRTALRSVRDLAEAADGTMKAGTDHFKSIPC